MTVGAGRERERKESFPLPIVQQIVCMKESFHYGHIIHGGAFRKPRGSCRQKNRPFVFRTGVPPVSFSNLVLEKMETEWYN